MNLEGSRALVTGGASGIGAATVALLHAAGARVAVLDIADAATQAAPGSSALAVACDVTDEDEVVGAVGRVADTFGGIDVAVLCAGVGGFGAMVDLTSNEWDRVLNVNLRGTFLCLREVGRAMTSSGRGGAVVAVGSVSGFLTDRLMAHYSVSKAGVAALVKVAARELGPAGVRVNAVAPGTTDTPLFASTARLPGYREQVAARTALGGVGRAEDVAAVIVALLHLDWVTGQVVAADGGVSLWSPIDPAERMGT